jgi:hypothetical protein
MEMVGSQNVGGGVEPALEGTIAQTGSESPPGKAEASAEPPEKPWLFDRQPGCPERGAEPRGDVVLRLPDLCSLGVHDLTLAPGRNRDNAAADGWCPRFVALGSASCDTGSVGEKGVGRPRHAKSREHSADELIAFPAASAPSVSIVPAARERDWMNDTAGRWANRCLPLVIANESGWVLLNPQAFEASWTGEDAVEGVTVVMDDDLPVTPIVESNFGYGILTWAVPYLFRTPAGYNLLARGPANLPKDGIAPLEGVVETDWSVATFTMNWKFTRTHHRVRFEVGEPYCMIVPQRRGELESFRPVIRELATDPETELGAKTFSESRHGAMVRSFLGGYSADYEKDHGSWQGDYYRGFYPDGRPAPVHQKHLRLSAFEGSS